MWGQPPPAVRASASSPFLAPHRIPPLGFNKSHDSSISIPVSAAELRSAGQPGAAVPTYVSELPARLYHVSVHSLTEHLQEHIRRHELLRAGDRVGIAVSGGIDS